MRRRILTGLIVTAITVVCTLFALEFGLRILGIGSDTLMRPDPAAGWVHIPGRRASVRSEDPALGRQIPITINALGLRDVERELPRTQGVRRILVLGDSYVEGQQVPAESTITRAMERDLNASGRGRFEVWNAGIAGYTTSQEYLYLRDHAAAFHPDLVVLAFLSGNDLADAVPDIATSLRNRPFYRESGDSLRLDRSQFRDDPPGIGWLRVHSRLFAWASTLRQVLQRGRARPTAAAGDRVPGDLQIYLDRPDSLWALAWRIEDGMILRTRDEAERQGAGFLLVAISNGAQEADSARARWDLWQAWKDRAPLSLDAPERHLESLSSSHGIDFLPLLPTFRDAAAADGRPRHIAWTGHWNSAGHALAARAIADRILERLAAPADSGAAPITARR